MTTPPRSPAIARALASEAESLPANFAKQVAALAESRAATRSSIWTAVAMFGAFAAMVAVCMFGWRSFGKPEASSAAWFEPFLQVLARQPWLIIGAAGFAIVQVLNFRRRTQT
jgi:hypothetical protein